MKEYALITKCQRDDQIKDTIKEKYFKLFAKLKQHGFVVLQMVAMDRGFNNTYKKLLKDLSIGM